MGYSYYRTITIDHTKVSTSTQTDFPWLYTNVSGRLTSNINSSVTTIGVSQSITSGVAPTTITTNDYIKIGSEIMQVTAGGGTSSLTVTRGQMSTSAASHSLHDWIINITAIQYLATVGNGGRVQNANGYDIIFCTSTSDASIVSFEVDNYDPVTGAIFAWIKGTLSNSVDTVFYLLYGNGSISTYQGSNAAVWSNGYLAVWHLPNSTFPTGTTLGVNDSLGSFNGTITGSVTAVAANLAGNANIPGGVAYIDVGGSSGLNTSTITIECWCAPINTGAAYMVIAKDDGTAAGKGYDLFVGQGQITLVFADGSAQAIYRVSSATLSFTTYNHVVVSLTGSTGAMYLQGSSVAFSNLGGAATGIANSTFNARIGARPSGSLFTMNGNVDELRVSNVVRSADWIATAFNNQDQPQVFYTVGAESSVPSAVFFTVCMDGGMRPQLKGGFNG